MASRKIKIYNVLEVIAGHDFRAMKTTYYRKFRLKFLLLEPELYLWPLKQGQGNQGKRLALYLK